MCCTNVGLSDPYGRGVSSRTIAIAGSISIRPKITVAGRDIFKVLPCMMDTIGPSPTDFRLGFQELFGTIICGNRFARIFRPKTPNTFGMYCPWFPSILSIDSLKILTPLCWLRTLACFCVPMTEQVGGWLGDIWGGIFGLKFWGRVRSWARIKLISSGYFDNPLSLISYLWFCGIYPIFRQTHRKYRKLRTSDISTELISNSWQTPSKQTWHLSILHFICSFIL